MRFRETSKIVTLLTRDFGKIKVIAKGALKPESRFGASLEPLTRSQVVFYRKEKTDLYTLSDADIIEPHSRLRTDLARLTWASVLLDFLDKANPFESQNPALYRLTLQALTQMARVKGEDALIALIGSFLLKASSSLGYSPELRKCVICTKTESTKNIGFNVAKGGIVCDRHRTDEDLPVSRETLKLLQRMRETSLLSATRIPNYNSKQELTQVLKEFIHYHLGSRLKSLDFRRKVGLTTDRGRRDARAS